MQRVSAKCIDLTWEKFDAVYYTGFKNNEKPKGAIAGGNGTYICQDESNQLILSLKSTAPGTNYKHKKNIIKKVKEVFGWERISNKRFLALKVACLDYNGWAMKFDKYGEPKIEQLGKTLMEIKKRMEM